jgi:hypothetical protein
LEFGGDKGALRDLEEAIELATEFADFKVLSLASSQKGTILRLNGTFILIYVFLYNIFD